MRRVLVVDDDDDVRDAVVGAVQDLGYSTAACASARDAIQALVEQDFSVIITDIRMPEIDGLGLCQRVLENHPDVAVVIMTAYGDVRSVVGAMRAEAVDFLRKPFSTDELGRVLIAAFGRAGTLDVARLSDTTVEGRIHELVGSSDAMSTMQGEVTRCAQSSSPVLVTGESGTGKELIARALHAHGRRSAGPFVALNCAAVPSGILASELFGCVRGAFTGAEESRRGLFRLAHGGTLFLDEIGAMPLELQPTLLRAIEVGAVRPVGSGREEAVDVRIVAATNSALDSDVRAGAFRQDLLFRLSVLRIHAPPLRERGGDIIELARHFLVELTQEEGRPSPTLSPAAIRTLLSYPWPGNVRELRNGMLAALTLGAEDQIGVEHLPRWLVANDRPQPRESDESGEHSLEIVERRHIERALAAAGGNKAEAARLLGIDRTTLYRKLVRLGLHDKAASG